MILIGRGLDLEKRVEFGEWRVEKKEAEEGGEHEAKPTTGTTGFVKEKNVKAKRKEAMVRLREAERSGGESRSDLCGFEGAST